MSLFAGPAEHAANPPGTWEVVRHGARWQLRPAGAAEPLDSYPTRTAAEAGRESGRLVDIYERESRWYAGEPIPGWRPWSEVAPGHGPTVS